MNYPLIRLKIVLSGNWHQFMDWRRQNEIKDGERVVYAGGVKELVGRQKENVELIKTGEWWKNHEGINALERLYPELLPTTKDNQNINNLDKE